MQKDHKINKTDLKLGWGKWMLRLEWYVFEEIRTIRSTKRKNCNRACQEKEATDHWHFGSIAQVTIATVYIASLDVIPQAFNKLACVFAVRNLCTILYKVIDGCAAIFCFNMGFYTGLRVWRTRRIVFINTVSPALLWVTLVALDTVSYKWMQKFSFSFFGCCYCFFLFFYGISSESFTASILCFQEIHLGIPWKFNLLEFPKIAKNKRCWWRRKSEIAEIPAHFRDLSPRTQKN